MMKRLALMLAAAAIALTGCDDDKVSCEDLTYEHKEISEINANKLALQDHLLAFEGRIENVNMESFYNNSKYVSRIGLDIGRDSSNIIAWTNMAYKNLGSDKKREELQGRENGIILKTHLDRMRGRSVRVQGMLEGENIRIYQIRDNAGLLYTAENDVCSAGEKNKEKMKGHLREIISVYEQGTGHQSTIRFVQVDDSGEYGDEKMVTFRGKSRKHFDDYDDGQYVEIEVIGPDEDRSLMYKGLEIELSKRLNPNYKAGPAAPGFDAGTRGAE